MNDQKQSPLKAYHADPGSGQAAGPQALTGQSQPQPGSLDPAQGKQQASPPPIDGRQTLQQPQQPSENAGQPVKAQTSVDKMTIDDLLGLTVQNDASDLHIAVGYPLYLRIDGELRPLGTEIINKERAKDLIYQLLDDNQKEILEVNKEVDLSYGHTHARFRINAYNDKGNLAVACRLIPSKIRSIEELKLPTILHEFTKYPQGLVLVVGPTGHGKSTSLAAMIQEINLRDAKHIVTIEDPIEYVYPGGRSLVNQRELHQDTHSWEIALRSVLREDPDVVLVGEMRDYETIAAAITVAETGHLVFGTLHTNSASQSIDRIIDVFPEGQQSQIRAQLASTIGAVISQRLIPIIGGGRRAVAEVMVGTPAVANAIREDKTYQIDNIIQTSADVGMITLEQSLVGLIREGKITLEDAQNYTPKPEELLRLVKK